MKKFLLLALFGSLGANASILGMLFIGKVETSDALKTGLAVERREGDFFMLLEMNRNGKRVEYGLRPGVPFPDMPSVVRSPLGGATAVLSIWSGEEYGWVGSENVTIVDPKLERTQQRTNLSEDIESMAKEGLLRDENGKSYTADEIREVALVFQVRSVMDRYEATTTYVHFPFGKFAEFEHETIKQLAGETITPKGAR